MTTITNLNGQPMNIAADRLPAALEALQRQIKMTHNDIRCSASEQRLAKQVADLRAKLDKLLAMEQQIKAAMVA